MQEIASFTIDHLRLQPGIYVSRQDAVEGAHLTTYDLRLKRPNRDEVISTGSSHAIEHLAASWLRSQAGWQDKVIYFGPMGCRTGFYLILAGRLSSREIAPLVIDCFRFISEYLGRFRGQQSWNAAITAIWI